MADVCTHAEPALVAANADGCEECLREGGEWVYLRVCQACGHVGCCDASPGRHATGHFGETEHAVVRSFEPGQDWYYCYIDDVKFEIDGAPQAPSHT